MAGKGEEVYVASIDQGTTSTRFIIYDRRASPVASHQLEFKQHYPEAGWVEHDPMEIIESVKVCMAKTLEKAAANGLNVDAGLKAIGITNQRETTVVWSKSTGLPLYNAIVWMDVRTSSICRRLESELSGGRTHFVETCGLPISTYFSALKLLWLMENVDAVKDAVRAGDALFGTIDTWLIWNLTGGIGGKDRDGKDGFPLAGVSISGCLGDQHAAMLGQLCQKGEAKSTYGTGAFILLNTGEEVTQSTHGLLSTIAYKLGPDAPTNYALEGSIAIAGAAVQWLRDSLGIISSAAEIEGLAESVQDSGGIYFVPAFNGLFAPWWRDDARGICIGITRFTNKGHIARAVLESMCFQVNDVLSSMHKDAGEAGEVKSAEGEFLLRVDGGATINNLLMQIQADLLGSPVVRPADIETTALGAAYAAGLAAGVWTKEEIFAGLHKENTTVFRPKLDDAHRKKRGDSWYKAVSRSFDLADLSL
ncbi:unnamed protein product [Triticum turgidum subsp. durum]|uniref:glycerol kinase n=1 Tax=Triticum turgidum subsp. durum TaxID=4567 RepID=A0A9R1Q0K4_TRITD|nr:unnamed protein product [Triticum turgidum subsp. durum]